MKSRKIINSSILLLLLMVCRPGYGLAQLGNVDIAEASMQRKGDKMNTSISLDLSGMKVNTNQAVVFTPIIVNGEDSLFLDGAGVYGRTRWYQFDRSGKNPISGVNEKALRYSKDLNEISLEQTVDYAEWMNGSQLVIKRTDYGCAGCDTGEVIVANLADYREVIYEPVFLFQEAVAESLKIRELSGRAYVDFPVNKIEIYPEYRNNTFELGKIIATIDSVKNDKDITVTSLHIAGTASPEGPYDNNVYLAKNRTISLKNYVQTLYKFPEGFITTSYEPVDWAGLREWLEKNNLENREEILGIVNSDIEPYARNTKIKTQFPDQYKWLLANVYPSLRHSDYRIEYTIRQFNDVEEIKEVINTAPQKLSLNEMYVLAGSLQPGSDEYNSVFETAVRMYPDDETANLNAANSAMQRGDLQTAARYLEKAGQSPKAIYARGVLEILKGNYQEGTPLVEKAISMGIEDNQGILENIKESAKYAQ